MKRAAVYGATLLLCFVALRTSWHAYYESKKQEAMRFCESLIPKVEAAKQSYGRYPLGIDPKWLEGQRVPQLVRPNDFYDSRGDMYRFHFRNPGDFMDDVWAYQCGPQQPCVWQNYDENRR
jgi:hypothetical protein